VNCILAIEDRTKLEKEITLGPDVQRKRSFLDLVAAAFGVPPLSDDCVIEIPSLGKLEDIHSLDDGDTVEVTSCVRVAVATSPSGFVHVSVRLLLWSSSVLLFPVSFPDAVDRSPRFCQHLRTNCSRKSR
jgi:hypothetical protein